MNYLLGIDIGTSSCKVDLFDERGNVVATSGARYEVICPRAGWTEQRPEDWWNGVCEAVRGLLAKTDVAPGDIAGIGLDGQSWSAVAIDGAGRVLCNTPIWSDMRSTRECAEMIAACGEDTLFDTCGNPCKPTYALPKILWYRNNAPEMFGRIDKILSSNGFIAYRLTGAISLDKCMGYGYQCFDMARGVWNEDIIRALKLPRGLFPELTECDTVVGRVTAQAAALTGLKEGTPVVAGGLDAACGTLGAGVYRDGQTQEQGGQAGGMSICMDRLVADRRLILSRHVVPGMFLLQGGTVGGSGALRWMSEQLCQGEAALASERGTNVFVEMSAAADRIPAGSDGMLFLPYMSGERTPIWDEKAEGVFYGVDFAKTRAHMIRAVMEGVAYSLKHNCDVAAQDGAEIESFYAMGGAANSLVWTQIKCDMTGKPIIVPNTDSATTLGAAILAGVGTGVFAGYGEAVERCVKITRTHTPDASKREVYEKGYARYLKLYEQLKELMHEA